MHKQDSDFLTPSSLFAHIYVIVVHELFHVPPKSLLVRVLGEDVRVIVLAQDLHNLQNPVLHVLSRKMVASLDVLRPLSQSLIVC